MQLLIRSLRPFNGLAQFDGSKEAINTRFEVAYCWLGCNRHRFAT